MAQKSTDDDLWQRAFNSLPASTIAELDPARTGVRNVAATLRLANEKCQLAKKKRWKVKKPDGSEIFLRDVMEKIVHWIDRFKAIGDNAVQFDPIHAALPWAAVRFLLQVAVNESIVHTSMVEDLELVARVIARFRCIESLYRPSPTPMLDQIEKALVEAYVVILEFLATAVHFFRDSTITRVLKSTLKTMDEKHRDAILAREAAVLNLARLIDGERLFNTERLVIRLADSTLSSQQEVEEKLYLDIMHWLSDVPFSRIHDGISQSRTPDTGTWLLQDEIVRSWLSSSSSSTLLLHGIPGCGKTLLCSALIDKCLADAADLPHPIPLAHFYCVKSEFERERRSAEGVLRSLARQLTVSRSPTLRIHSFVVTKYKQLVQDAKLDGFSIPKAGISDCVNFILAALEDNPATIVVDALDETDEPKTLLDSLHEIIAKSSNVIKIALSSRNDSAVLAIASSSLKVRITEEKNKADIIRFTTHCVEKAVSDYKLLRGSVMEPLKQELVTGLTRQAGEMFRWIELQIQRLCDLNVEADVRNALCTLDMSTLQSLHLEAYRRIAQGGDTAHQIAMRTFSWLLYVREALTPDTFLSAVAVTLQPQQVTLDNLLHVCRSFVYLDSTSNILRFAHHSAQDFLRLQPIFTPESAHDLIGLSCLTICRSPPMDEITQLKPAESIYDYAVLYLGYHCASAQVSPTCTDLYERLDEFIFDQNDPAVPFMIWMDCVIASYSSLPPDHEQEAAMQLLGNKQNCPLFFFCVFGLSGVLARHQWPSNFDWNQRNDQGQSGLYVATYFGHINVVIFLLAQGADVDLDGGRLGSALHCSAFRGHVEIVRILLNHGASAKLADQRESALQVACRSGHEEVALVLLRHKFNELTQSDIDLLSVAFSGAGFTLALTELNRHPLTSILKPTQLRENGTKAIISGNVANLQYWLRKSSFTDTVPSASVALSALYGHEAMTNFLINNGMSVEEAGYMGSPLRCASLNGHNRVCQILLGKGANVNSNGALGSALHAACIKGNLHTAKLLLDFGADANAQGGFYGTSLQAAAFLGHTEVVSCLLSAGADPLGKGFSEDAFHAAAEGGRQGIITLLLNAGHKPPSKLRRGGRTKSSKEDPSWFRDLLQASAQGYRNRLIERNLNFDETKQIDHSDSRPAELSITSDFPRQQMVPKPYRSRREDGFRDAEKRRDYALEAAAAMDHLNVVTTMLERIDDEGKSGEKAQEALLTACKHGRIEIVEIISRWSAPGNVPLRAALCKAALHGHMTVIESLLRLTGSYKARISDLKSALISSVAATNSTFHEVLRLVQGNTSFNNVQDIQYECLAAAAEHTSSEDVVRTILTWGNRLQRDALLALLKIACRYGSIDVCKVISEILQPDDINSSILRDNVMAAIHGQRAEIVQFWLQQIKIHFNSEHFEDVVLLAAGYGSEDILRYLLDDNVHMAGRDGRSETIGRALIISARKNHHESCVLLISRGADPTKPIEPPGSRGKNFWSVDQYSRSIFSPGHFVTIRYAAKNAIESAVAGIRDSMRDYDESRIDLLVHYEKYEKTQLRSRGRRRDIDHVAVTFDLRKQRDLVCARHMTLRLLLQSTITSGVKAPISANTLCMAASFCPLEVLTLLLDNGANPNAQSEGRSALELAIQHQAFPLPFVQALIGAGACLRKVVGGLETLLNTGLSSFPSHSGEPQRLRGLLGHYEKLDDVFGDGPGGLIYWILLQLPGRKAGEDAFAVILQCAAAANQADFVDLLIQRDVNVNQTGSYFGTALQAACFFGRLQITHKLLRAGADPNIVQGRHHTALIAAVAGGHIEVVKTLLANGVYADLYILVSRRSPWDYTTALQIALELEYIDIALELVGAGADVNQRLHDGIPLIARVLMTGTGAIVDAFVAAGANLGLQDNESRLDGHHRLIISKRRTRVTPKQKNPSDSMLTSSACSEDINTATRIRRSVPQIPVDELNSSLQIAVRYGNLDVTEWLLDAGAILFDVARDIDMVSIAASHGHVKILRRFLAILSRNGQARDVCEYITRGLTAIKPAILEVLLDYMPCTEALLLEACKQQYEEAVGIGLEQGLSADTVDKDGRSLLYIAAKQASVPIVRLLLDYGADPRKSDRTGIPIVLVVLEGYMYCGLLERTLYKVKTSEINRESFLRPLWTSYRDTRKCYDIIDLLLKRGARAETSPGKLGTVLTFAAYLGLRSIFHLLLDAGADLFASGGVFISPLFAAIHGGHTRLVREILRLGAVGGFDEVFHACEKGNYGAVALLLADQSMTLTVSETDQLISCGLKKIPSWGQTDGYWTDPRSDYDQEAILDLLLDTFSSTPITKDHMMTAAEIGNPKICFRVLSSLCSRASPHNVPEAVLARLSECEASSSKVHSWVK